MQDLDGDLCIRYSRRSDVVRQRSDLLSNFTNWVDSRFFDMFEREVIGRKEVWVKNGFIHLSNRTGSERFLSEFGEDFVEGESEGFLKDFPRMSERVGDTLRVQFTEEETEFGGEEVGT